MNLCFVCHAQPTEDAVGRAVWECARGIAALGHEVHFITRSPDHNRVDFEDGVWVHRLLPEKEGAWGHAELAPTVRAELGHAAAAHKEVRRIRQWRRVDLVDVAAPRWDGLVCLEDDDLSCILTLHPQMPASEPQTSVEFSQRFCLESLALRSARRMHSIGSEPLAALRRHGLHPGPAVMVLPADDLARHALHAYEEFLDRRSVA